MSVKKFTHGKNGRQRVSKKQRQQLREHKKAVDNTFGIANAQLRVYHRRMMIAIVLLVLSLVCCGALAALALRSVGGEEGTHKGLPVQAKAAE